MNEALTVSIDVKVTDAVALQAAARQRYLNDNPKAGPAELKELFGPISEPNLSACLIEIFDPGISPDGTSILQSSVD